MCKYCIDIVSDPKGQEDLVSGAKEKELFPDPKFPLQYSNYCTVLLNDENHSYNDVIRWVGTKFPKIEWLLLKSNEILQKKLSIFKEPLSLILSGFL